MERAYTRVYAAYEAGAEEAAGAALTSEQSASIPTTIKELSEHLARECYHDSQYHIGSGWSSCGDTYCIEHTRAGFEIFYVERGQRSYDLCIESSESIACRRFIDVLDQSRWSKAHCIAFTPDLDQICHIADVLASAGIESTQNDIPHYHATGDIRYRLFVFGRDLRRVEHLVAYGLIPPVVISR